MIQEATIETENGPQVGLSYLDQRRITNALLRTIDPRRHLTNDPVVLTAIGTTRHYLRATVENILPEAVFMSFS